MSLVRNNRPLFPRWGNFFEGFLPDDRLIGDAHKYGSMPAANIEEKDDEFVITLAIPGVKKEDIEIEVHDNVIRISSEKEDTSEDNEKNYSRREYSYSSFNRTFRLPQGVKEEAILANYQNGELILQLPKDNPVEKSIKKIQVA